MRFMMLMIPKVYQPGTPASERAGEGFAPPVEAVRKMMKFNEELAKSGALISLDGLQPEAKGARISFAGGHPRVRWGHAAGAREVIGGYWLIRTESTDQAVDWARRCPAADGDTIEVRPVFEMSDFPADVRKVADNSAVSTVLVKGRDARGI